ncbi:MAG TPA: flavodoxin domain-containing protein [Bacteroidia bacterium]|nr:flavodoxin domain-containing protein [Bacteroidia bacterium]
MHIKVVYATETGNSEDLAKDTVRCLNNSGFETGKPINLGTVDLGLFDDADVLLAIVSTWGDGEPPSEAESFHHSLTSSAPLGLGHLRFAVLALGDTGYDLFCQYGKDLDAELERHGAIRLHDRTDCDIDFDDYFTAWVAAILGCLSSLREQRSCAA